MDTATLLMKEKQELGRHQRRLLSPLNSNEDDVTANDDLSDSFWGSDLDEEEEELMGGAHEFESFSEDEDVATMNEKNKSKNESDGNSNSDSGDDAKKAAGGDLIKKEIEEKMAAAGETGDSNER